MAGKLTASTLEKCTFTESKAAKNPSLTLLDSSASSALPKFILLHVRKPFGTAAFQELLFQPHSLGEKSLILSCRSTERCKCWGTFLGSVETSFITLCQIWLRSICVTLIKACVEWRGIKKDEQRDFYWLDQETELCFLPSPLIHSETLIRPNLLA